MRVVHVVVLVMGILVCSINSDTDPTDATALRVMFTSLNSPKQLSKWTANGGDPCGDSWKGITCSGSKVTEINIGHNQLRGQLGDNFSQLKSLTMLDLSYNFFTGDLPQSFSTLSRLRNMNLQNNQLTGTINILANLPLDNLNVANNLFSGWVPSQLKHTNIQIDGNSFNSGPAPLGTSITSSKKSKGVSKSFKKGGFNSGIEGVVIAAIVILFIIVMAIVIYFVIKRRSRKRQSRDVEKADTHQPSSPLASPKVQETKTIQTSSIANAEKIDTSASINQIPPPNKSFDEDDFSRKPIVTKKLNTAPIDEQENIGK